MSNTPSSTFECLNQVTITFCGVLAILERHCLFHSVFQRKQLSSQAAEHLAFWFKKQNRKKMNCRETGQVSNLPDFFIIICGKFWLGLMTIHIYAPVCFLKSHAHSNLQILRVKPPRIKGVTSSMFYYYYSVWGFFFNHKIIHKHMLLVLGTNFSIFSYLLISLFSCVHSYLLEVLKYITMAASTSTAENLLKYYTKVLAVLHLPACSIESIGMCWIKGFLCKSHNEQ